jgi:hypothetical protein
VPDTGWSVGIVLADAELFANLEQLAGEVLLIGGGGELQTARAVQASDDLTLLAVARIGDANTSAWEAQSP